MKGNRTLINDKSMDSKYQQWQTQLCEVDTTLPLTVVTYLPNSTLDLIQLNFITWVTLTHTNSTRKEKKSYLQYHPNRQAAAVTEYSLGGFYLPPSGTQYPVLLRLWRQCRGSKKAIMNLQPRKICLLVVLCRAFYRKFVLPFVSRIEKEILRADYIIKV